jgi:hypothetical protein
MTIGKGCKVRLLRLWAICWIRSCFCLWVTQSFSQGRDSLQARDRSNLLSRLEILFGEEAPKPALQVSLSDHKISLTCYFARFLKLPDQTKTERSGFGQPSESCYPVFPITESHCKPPHTPHCSAPELHLVGTDCPKRIGYYLRPLGVQSPFKVR